MTEDAWQAIRDSLIEATMLQRDVTADRLAYRDFWDRLDALATETVKRLGPQAHEDDPEQERRWRLEQP